MAQWSRLATYLSEQSSDTVTLSWNELGLIVGELPATTTAHRPWWSGNRGHVRQWRAAGFTVHGLRMGQEVTFVRVSSPVELPASAGDSTAQREVEAIMLGLLSSKLGMELVPQRLIAPGGSYIDVDGVASDGSVLAECWAHQGTAKVAQKYKLVNDAAKLQWARAWLDPAPSRLLLCVSDEAAVKHLRGTSWQGQAIAAMGVELVVVELPPEVVETVLEAQRAQFR